MVSVSTAQQLTLALRLGFCVFVGPTCCVKTGFVGGLTVLNPLLVEATIAGFVVRVVIALERVIKHTK